MSRKNKLAFSLSGGSFGCLAYVSFLEVLRDGYDVKPDMIAGFSGGAMVAPFVSLGMSSVEVRQIFQRLSIQKIINLNVKHFELVDHKKLIKFFRDELPIRNLEDLPTPVHIFTSNVKTQKPEIISTGDIASAVVASCSLFPLLEPIKRQGMLLTDGGYTSKFGVRELKKLGADKIIGVDVTGLNEGSTPYFLKSLFYSVNAAIKTFGRYENKEHPCDLTIEIDVKTPTLLQLKEKMDYVFKVGEREAKKWSSRIKKQLYD